MFSGPKVSILLPVYNSEAYLQQTISSLLEQRFADFELIIINDGSTDGSGVFIDQLTDNRIRKVHQSNQGLIATLNRGLDMAKGNYVARMDADDVATKDRLEKQVAYLDAHSDCAVVAGFCTFIDANDQPIGYWELDREVISRNQIRTMMPIRNCLVHPSIMGRTEILRTYKYNPTQVHIEDYDLWLRLLADGHAIDKIPEVLLQYRKHMGSITQTHLQAAAAFKRSALCKYRFLKSRKRVSSWELKIGRSMCIDYLTYLKKSLL
jgi:glycosyltransferase involved in cell wall biosynthesis